MPEALPRLAERENSFCQAGGCSGVQRFVDAPARVPPLPERGRLSSLTACPTWSTGAAATAARLARLGWNTVAVPLDHDPVVTGSILPYLVNVVVTRG